MKANDDITKSLKRLHQQLRQVKNQGTLHFSEFLITIRQAPRRSLRDIFQLFYDMLHHYVPAGTNEYPNDPESINYIDYDMRPLLVDDTETPFFADRILSNRLINVVDSLCQGAMQNKMLTFVGPPGSGKSTFLNNLLRRVEEYTTLNEGVMYETIWQIEPRKLGYESMRHLEKRKTDTIRRGEKKDPDLYPLADDEPLLIPCPSHDHPIVQIPKEYRESLLLDVIGECAEAEQIFTDRAYEWVFSGTPCPVCSSIYKALSQRISPEEILEMLHVRRYEFSRKLGDGISVFNPGDEIQKAPLENLELQRWLDSLFKSSSAVGYIYSRLAKTNNGIFVIMDAKSNNVERLKNIHGVISDGIHKVGAFEEEISSLFMTLINPEDIDVIEKEKSFRDRVINIPIAYVRDYKTEAEIYRNTCGPQVEQAFMPRVLTSFAKVVVASRLEVESKAVTDWINDTSVYKDVCDANMQLLRMELLTGSIPPWLKDEHRQSLRRHERRNIIREGEVQGLIGFSGRKSISMFHNLLRHYQGKDQPITIENTVEFFSDPDYAEKIPDGFLQALVNNYDYTTLQEVKEAMFFYNPVQIDNNIKNYLFAINHDFGAEVESPYTGEHLSISNDYLVSIEEYLLNSDAEEEERKQFRDSQLQIYVSRTLHELHRGGDITETEQFTQLVDRYNRNLKRNVLEPFASNTNFRRAIKDYDTESFRNYDQRIRSEVELLMNNLISKFGYVRQSARMACIYVIDKDLSTHF